MPYKNKEDDRQWHREYMKRKRAIGYYGSDFRIFERDCFRCQYCGKTPRDGIQLQVDHITPRCLGGDDRDDNLITACAQCNGNKSGRLLKTDAEQAIRQGVTVTPTLEALRQIIKGIKGKEQPEASIPLYNPQIHRPGDTVLVRPQYGRSKKLMEITIPQLDADGNPMPIG